jgi:2-keto-3-deoxy-L-fuconate dehydrogenase
MAEFTGLSAIVTGGGSGIGAAIAAEFADRGCRVAVLDREPGAPLGETVSLTVDVSDDESVRAGVAQAAEQLGGIDIVVNCAGISATGDVEANSDDEWHRVLDVNVIGIARVTRAALPWLRRSSHPAVVNIASVVAHVGIVDRVLYGASKGAVVAMTLAMAADHVREGIRVNAVSPGTADTPWVQRLLQKAADPEAAAEALRARQPMGRLVSAAEVAYAVASLASPRAGATTGAILSIDGGMANVRA